MSNHQVKRDSGFFESEDIKFFFNPTTLITFTDVASTASITKPTANKTLFSSYLGLYEIQLTKKSFDKLLSSHYWTHEALENTLPSKKITTKNIKSSNINNNSNSKVEILNNNNNKSTTTIAKIQETSIPFSNYLGLILTNQQYSEKFDIADHYWTNLSLEAILPSKYNYNAIKNKKNKKISPLTPSSINLNLFTKHKNMGCVGIMIY
ncbi:16459_t:CDS:2 [Entrophospora sp. SA101]|nr:16459_t:CDS:2 [Entrophospora sp. SA101]